MNRDFKDTLAFEDALRIAGPMAFNLMIKPAGSLCNLDCHYCYYLDKSDIYGGKEPRMNPEMLEKCIKEYIEANDVPRVTFNWHGGEPLVMGLDFFRRAVALQQRYCGSKTILNTIQTNGTLVDDGWASFFKNNGFLVGVSIDGPRDIHDRHRKDKGGAPTFDKVMRGIEIMYRHGVEYNTMSAVSNAAEGRGKEVYAFLKGLGTRFMQFMPVVEHVVRAADESGKPLKNVRPHIVHPDVPGARIAPWSVSSLAFGRFLCDVFDEWMKGDVGRFFVNIFDCTLANWCGAQPGTCVYDVTCGGNSVIEHNGDVYPCDHFVYPEYKIGNISSDSLRTMMGSAIQTKFGIGKRNNLPRKCLRCKWLFACHGECPKHRFSITDSGETGLNALCSGYEMFFSHAAPFMDKMKELLEAGRPPAEVMMWAKFRD